MDPDRLYEEMIDLAQELVDNYGNEELAEMILDLDEWIKRGGYLPAAWER